MDYSKKIKSRSFFSSLSYLSLLVLVLACCNKIKVKEQRLSIKAFYEEKISGIKPQYNSFNVKVEIDIPENDSIKIIKLYNSKKEELFISHCFNKTDELSTYFEYEKFYKYSIIILSKLNESKILKNNDSIYLEYIFKNKTSIIKVNNIKQKKIQK